MLEIASLSPQKPYNTLQLKLNGKLLDLEDAYAIALKDRRIVSVDEPKLFDEFIKLDLSVFMRNFSEISLVYPYYFTDDFKGFFIEGVEIVQVSAENITIKFKFGFEMSQWRQLWSMLEHANSFRLVLEQVRSGNITWDSWNDEEPFNGFIASFPVSHQDVSIKSIIEYFLDPIDDAHLEVINILSSQAHINSVAAYFKFPDSVKVSCQQYLVYFVQFLQDIGISATAELKEEAGKTLFSVTPTNKEQALSHVKTALDIYLRLPGAVSVYTPSLDSSIEIQRLTANIYHLKGQLALADAILQQKDQIIQDQRILIGQQQYSTEILMQSIQTIGYSGKDFNDADDRESIVGDIVSVKKYNWEFLEVDLPTLFRRLKNVFGRNRGK